MSSHEVMLGFQFLSSTLGGDSTLAGYAPGGVWRALAPPSSEAPYVIMAFQAGSDIVTMNGVRLIVEATFQAKAVGPASETATIVNAAERIDVLLGGIQGMRDIAVTGGEILSCYRQSPLQVSELVAGELWESIGGLYRLQIESS